MAKVRRKVLQQFTRNIGGAIVTGHPQHPDENGRFLVLEEDVADKLADEGLIETEDTVEKMPKPGDEGYAPAPAVSAKVVLQEIVDTMGDDGKIKVEGAGAAGATNDSIMGLIAEGEGKGEGGGDTGAVEGNTGGANGDVVGGAGGNSAQATREKRVAGKPVAADTKAKGNAQRGGKTDKTKAPAGGGSTNATTNHPIESGPQTPPAEIPGAPSEPDPDAAPTSGSSEG